MLDVSAGRDCRAFAIKWIKAMVRGLFHVSSPAEREDEGVSREVRELLLEVLAADKGLPEPIRVPDELILLSAYREAGELLSAVP